MRTWVLAVALLTVLALSSCAPPTSAVDVSRLPHGVQSPLPDSGPAKERAEVRASLVDALSVEEDQLARTEEGAPLHTATVRRARLRSVESTALATRDLAAMAFLTDNDTPFRASHFAVTSWQGVVVRGDLAKAYVLGHNIRVLWDGSSRGEPDFQYKALLRRDSHAPDGWVLTGYRAASNEQG